MSNLCQPEIVLISGLETLHAKKSSRQETNNKQKFPQSITERVITFVLPPSHSVSMVIDEICHSIYFQLRRAVNFHRHIWPFTPTC